MALGSDKVQNKAVLGGGLVRSASQTPHLGVWNASQSVRAMLEQWQLGLFLLSGHWNSRANLKVILVLKQGDLLATGSIMYTEDQIEEVHFLFKNNVTAYLVLDVDIVEEYLPLFYELPCPMHWPVIQWTDNPWLMPEMCQIVWRMSRLDENQLKSIF